MTMERDTVIIVLDLGGGGSKVEQSSVEKKPKVSVKNTSTCRIPLLSKSISIIVETNFRYC